MTQSKPPVLIVGALSDIAREIALQYAKQGHSLQLVARRSERLDRDVSDIAIRYGVEVTKHELDVSDVGAQDGFIDSLPSLPSVVVCAVGLLGDQDADALDDAAVARIVVANYIGPCRLLEKMATKMATTNTPSAIVGIGSVAGDRGRAKNYIYGSAKSGFEAYMSGLRQKYVETKLQVMTVKPGFVRTAMTEGMDTPAPLTTDAASFAQRVVKAQQKGSLVYYDLRWRVLMGIIKHVPEPIFRKMKF